MSKFTFGRQLRMIGRIARSLLIQIIVTASIVQLTQTYPISAWEFLLLQAGVVGLALLCLRENLGLILANIFLPFIAAGLVFAEIPQAVLPGVATVLVLFFYPTLKTGVPLFTTSAEATAKLLERIEGSRASSFAELGAGEGTLSAKVAARFPLLTVTAFELGVLSFLVLWGRSLFRRNIKPKLKDFFKTSWADFDVLFCFLAPPLMSSVWEKFESEAKSGALLISNAFAVEGVNATEIIPVKNILENNMFVYKKK